MKLFFRIIAIGLISFVIPGFSAPLGAQPTNFEADLGTAIQGFDKLNDGQKETVLGAMGLPKSGAWNVADLAAYLIFGSIGFIAFFYGRKQSSWRPTIIGVALMVYPYAVSGTFLLYFIGILFTACLYFSRE